MIKKLIKRRLTNNSINYFEKRYGKEVQKINILCRMKTRRNKGRNKTRKGRKGRRTYKTRKYGAGKGNGAGKGKDVDNFKSKPFNSTKFLNIYKTIQKEKEEERKTQERIKEEEIKKQERKKEEEIKKQEERNKIEKEEDERRRKKERNTIEKAERIKKERDESGINNSVMTSEEVYNITIKNHPKIKNNPKINDNFIQFLAKLNDKQRKEINDYKYKYDIKNILTHYIELKYNLRTFSTKYSIGKPNYYDDRTYVEYVDDQFNGTQDW